MKDLSTGIVKQDVCDILLSASGILNDWKWPEIKGLHDFKGKLLHSAKWDEKHNYSVCGPFKPLFLRLYLTRTIIESKCSSNRVGFECYSDCSWNSIESRTY